MVKSAVNPKRSWVVVLAAIVSLGLLSYIYAGRATVRARYVAPVRVGDYSGRPYDPRLVAAAGRGDVATVGRLLAHGVSPNAVDGTESGEALEAAAAAGSPGTVGLLLDKGADINAPDFWGGTALVSAAAAGHTEVVRLLLSRGADVNADDDGATALGYAQSQGYQDVVGVLERAGAR